ncbi:hypothetical protein [Alteribacter keqinensis]|uniref:Uncharacterized protein n=1 Tax=Alteribacter keqinensis TaxID=2483800 RepID=A0A3M7TWH0_9BACI|nr:hypothetical protein [Alteribacter keqinensis]RNA69916.1 hypothetical protein EBO34_08285 [Alteribacter keqinensis]
MKKKVPVSVAAVILLLIVFSSPAFANSSWQWVTDSPRTLLPVAIALTLVIEITGIFLFGRLVKSVRVLVIGIGAVVLANFVSFILPYAVRAGNFLIYSGEWGIAWNMAATSGPYYIILLGYLGLTVLVEVPIVYYALKRYTRQVKTLLIVIITVNIITTLFVALMERMMFHGQW